MRGFTLLLGGLLVWAADFLLLYAIGSIWMTTPLARVLVGAVTLAMLALDGWLLTIARARFQGAGDELEKWTACTGGMAAALSALAILWQGFPAIFA